VGAVVLRHLVLLLHLPIGGVALLADVLLVDRLERAITADLLVLLDHRPADRVNLFPAVPLVDGPIRNRAALLHGGVVDGPVADAGLFLDHRAVGGAVADDRRAALLGADHGVGVGARAAVGGASRVGPRSQAEQRDQRPPQTFQPHDGYSL